MFITLSNISKKYHRIKRLFCPNFCLNTTSCSIGKAFTSSIHTCPKTIIVTIVLFPILFHARLFHGDFKNKLIWRSSRVSIYFIFIPFCFFTKSKRFMLYYTYPIGRCEPSIPIRSYSYRSNIVIRQPAFSLSIFPRVTIIMYCAFCCTKPNISRISSSHSCKIIKW